MGHVFAHMVALAAVTMLAASATRPHIVMILGDDIGIRFRSD
jgi:hypothetical protein